MDRWENDNPLETKETVYESVEWTGVVQHTKEYRSTEHCKEMTC